MVRFVPGIEAVFRLDLTYSIEELLGSAIMRLASLELPIEGEDAKEQARLQEPVMELLGRIFYLSEDELYLGESEGPFLLLRQYTWYKCLLTEKGESELVRSVEQLLRIHGLFQSGDLITDYEVESMATVILEVHTALHNFNNTFDSGLDFARETWQTEVRASRADQEIGDEQPKPTEKMTMEQLKEKYGDHTDEKELPTMEIIVVMHSVSSSVARYYLMAPMEEWPLPLEQPPVSEDADPAESLLAARLFSKLSLVGGIEGLSVTTRYVEICVGENPDWKKIRGSLEEAICEVFEPRIRYLQFISSAELTLQYELLAEDDDPEDDDN